MELSKKNSKFLKKKSIKKLCNLVRRRDFRQVQKCFFFHKILTENQTYPNLQQIHHQPRNRSMRQKIKKKLLKNISDPEKKIFLEKKVGNFTRLVGHGSF